MSESDSEPPFDLDSPDAFEGPVRARGDVFSHTGFARAIGKTRKTIDRMIRDGLPILARGDAATRAPHQIDLAAAWDWSVAFAREQERMNGPGSGIVAEDAFDEEKTRDKAAQATLRELQVEEAMGRLIDLSTVRRFEGERAELFRNGCQSLFTQVRDLTPDQIDDFKKAVNAMLANIVQPYVPQHRIPINDDAPESGDE